jgi:hypothetical protein
LKLIEPYEGRPRWPGTYVLVAWVTGTYLDTNGASKEKIEKAWETRATLIPKTCLKGTMGSKG